MRANVQAESTKRLAFNAQMPIQDVVLIVGVYHHVVNCDDSVRLSAPLGCMRSNDLVMSVMLRRW